MELRDAFFYATGAALLASGVLTVTARNLFRAALALLGVLWSTAMLFLLLGAEMVALVQVMVYIGGILIFVLYAVLLTSELGGRMPAPSLAKAAGGLVAAGTFLALLVALAWWSRDAVVDIVGPGAVAEPRNIAGLKALGLRLLDPGPNGFLVPFELISVVLLAAMVGAIALARQAPRAARPAGAPASPDAVGGLDDVSGTLKDAQASAGPGRAVPEGP